MNENYNPIINAQLLSSYYVSAFLAGENYAKGIDLNAEKTAIILHQPYNNPHVNMHQMIELIMKLRSKPFAEVKEKKTPFDLIAGLIKK